jgi:hypothetical protein
MLQHKSTKIISELKNYFSSSEKNISNTIYSVLFFENYENFGALFSATKAEILELNIKERICLIITEIITTLLQFFEIDIESLTKHIIANNNKFTKLLNLKHY